MRERKRKAFNQNYNSGFKIGRYSSVVVGCLLVASLFIFVSLISSRTVYKQDEINVLNSKKQELEKERDRLKYEANRLQSIQEIQKTSGQSSDSKMVPVKKINYLPSSNVALR
jgi:cell division protein FtsL